jgi:hypothetical protein
MTKLYTPRDIKLALLDMFTYGLFGSANRASGEMKMKLCPDTDNELEIKFNIWGYKLTESKAIEWAGKEFRKAEGKKPEDAPTFYFGVEDKQSKAFFIDPVESLMGEDEIDSGKGPQEDGAVVARDTQNRANAKTRAKMNQAERDDAEVAA